MLLQTHLWSICSLQSLLYELLQLAKGFGFPAPPLFFVSFAVVLMRCWQSSRWPLTAQLLHWLLLQLPGLTDCSVLIFHLPQKGSFQCSYLCFANGFSTQSIHDVCTQPKRSAKGCPNAVLILPATLWHRECFSKSIFETLKEHFRPLVYGPGRSKKKKKVQL